MAAALFAAFAASVSPLPAGESAPTASRESNLAEVRRIGEQDRRSATNSPDVLVLPGLRADRKTRSVRILAESTGVAVGTAIEFLLIGESSGHDYEALAVSLAKPSDVHKALEFIGMKPGRAADVSKLRFRPKGERVVIFFRARDAARTNEAIRAEDFIVNPETRKTLPHTGFVFIGSVTRAGDGQTQPVYAADAFEPGSIVSTYNESESVLDVPREAAQRDVYGTLVASPAFAFGTNCLIDVLMEPEYKDGKQRCIDLNLRAAAGEDGAISASVRDPSGKLLNPPATIESAVDAMLALVRRGHTPFVTLHIADALSLRGICTLCRALNAIDVDDEICMDAPPAGELFYRAFLPSESFRARAGRISQPWELKLTLDDGRTEGILTQIEQIWHDNEAMPELRVRDFPVPTPDALRRELDSKDPGLPVILVFAPPDLTYGQLMEFVRPAMKTHPTIHVFTEQPKAAVKAPALPPQSNESGN